MKTMHIIFLWLAVCSLTIANAQGLYYESPFCFDSYLLDGTYIKSFPLPVVREVKTGTKIIPEFVGNWNYEAQGAFMYACKIWEEVIPTTYPIKIRAVMDTTTPKTQYSEIESTAYKYNGGGLLGNYKAVYLSQAKATTFGMETGQYFRPSDELQLDSVSFFTPEMQITYFNFDQKIDDNCSFSLEGNTDSSHYDFVSMALRDIAKGLGVACSFKRGRNKSTGIHFLRVDQSSMSPFESEVLYALDITADSCTWLYNATQGALNVGGYNLYAPTQWDIERSLNYFVPNNNEKITQLLDYNFGKGSVVRQIDDSNLKQKLFKNLLKWKGLIPVGNQSNGLGMTELATSTEDDIPYNASTIFSWEGLASYSSGHGNGNTIIPNYIQTLSRKNSEYPISTWQDYMKQFRPNYIPQTGTLSSEGLFISFMKENGTWDLVYSWPFLSIPVEVDSSDVIFHYNMEEYARTLDGKLRCRVVVYSENPDNKQNKVRYFHVDKLPRKVKMQPFRVINDEDDYYRDVKIGLRNLEGITRVVVSQWDEGETYPYIWDETDYDQGYFIATVDKELYTRFEIKAYNQNGYTITDTIVAPLEPLTELSLQFNYCNESIGITLPSHRIKEKNFIEAIEIRPIASTIKTSYKFNAKAVCENNNFINIKNLPGGLYVLTVYDVRGGRHDFKFHK